MAVRYAVGLPTVGAFGDVHTLVDLVRRLVARRHRRGR